jgi:multidrug efflux pump subunit AcrA (membrane-fusion protein)
MSRSHWLRSILSVSCAAAALTSFAASGIAADVPVESVVINLVAEVEVPAIEAGALVELRSPELTRVEAGDLLVRIDDRDAALDVARAQIAVDHAEHQAANDVKIRQANQTLKLAELDLKKADDANREVPGVVSATQVEKIRIAIENAQLEIELATRDQAAAQRAVAAAKNELQVAQRSVERRRIVAPIAGVVVDVRKRTGEWLKPGDTVLRIVRDDRLRAEGFVDVQQLIAPLLGELAELTVALPGGKSGVFRGKVTFVSPEANPINRQVRVWAEFDNQDGRLRPGLSARMVIRPTTSGAGPKAGNEF